MAEDDNYIGAMPLHELLRAAAGALRWSHDELKHAGVEGRNFLTIEHPQKKILLLLAERLEEVAGVQPRSAE